MAAAFANATIESFFALGIMIFVVLWRLAEAISGCATGQHS